MVAEGQSWWWLVENKDIKKNLHAEGRGHPRKEGGRNRGKT